MAHKFSQIHPDPLVARLFQEASDNMATNLDLSGKMAKTAELSASEPSLKTLSDGDEEAYNDGSNYYLYRRIGGKLFKFQLTEV